MKSVSSLLLFSGKEKFYFPPSGKNDFFSRMCFPLTLQLFDYLMPLRHCHLNTLKLRKMNSHDFYDGN
jgi:hypothetical protein